MESTSISPGLAVLFSWDNQACNFTEKRLSKPFLVLSKDQTTTNFKHCIHVYELILIIYSYLGFWMSTSNKLL